MLLTRKAKWCSPSPLRDRKFDTGLSAPIGDISSIRVCPTDSKTPRKFFSCVVYIGSNAISKTRLKNPIAASRSLTTIPTWSMSSTVHVGGCVVDIFGSF